MYLGNTAQIYAQRETTGEHRTRGSDGSYDYYVTPSGMGGKFDGGRWVMYMPTPGVTYETKAGNLVVTVRNRGDGFYDLIYNGQTSYRKYSPIWNKPGFPYFDVNATAFASPSQITATGDPGQYYMTPGESLTGATNAAAATVSGVTDAEIRAYVESVLNNVNFTEAQKRYAITSAMAEYKVSMQRLAQATGYTLAEIQAYLYPPAASAAPAPSSPAPAMPAPVVTAPAPSSPAPAMPAPVMPVPAMPAPVMPVPVTGGGGTIFGPGTGTPLDAGFPDVNAPAPQASDSKLPLLALGVALALFS